MSKVILIVHPADAHDAGFLAALRPKCTHQMLMMLAVCVLSF